MKRPYWGVSRVIGEIVYRGFIVLEWLVALLALLFGIFSAVSPSGMIKLYQWIMRKFNWQVSPIDEERERRNTRSLGLVLALLAALLIIILLVRN